MIVGPSLPFGNVIFCDDIRLEEGGKRSLMGIYQSELVFQGPAPGMLPMLCMQISWTWDAEDPPHDLAIRVYRDGGANRETLFSADVKVADVNLPTMEPDEVEPDAPRVASLSLEARFGALQFETDCRLRVRIAIGDKEHRAGAIAVRFSGEPPVA